MEAGVPQQTRRRRRWWRRGLKVVKWVLISVFLVVALVLLYLQTDHGKATLRDIVVDAVNGGIKGRLEVDRITGSVIADIGLHGVRLYDPDGALVLSVAEISADLHPFDLIDQTVHLSDLRLREPVVQLRDAAGRIGIARVFEPRVPAPDPPPPSGPSPWVIQLERVALADGAVSQILDDPPLALSDLSLDLTFGLGPTGLFWRDLVLRAVLEGVSVDTVAILSEGRMEGDTLHLSTLQVDADPHHISLAGTLDIGSLDAAEVTLTDLTVDLDRLPAEIAARLPLGGIARGSGTLRLADGALAADIGLISDAGRVVVQAGAELGGADLTYDATVRFDGVRPGALRMGLPPTWIGEGMVRLRGVGNPLDGGSLDGRGDIVELAPNPGGALTFTVRNVQGGMGAAGVPGAAFAVELGATDFTADPWLDSFVGEGLRARLASLAASGTVLLPAEGAPWIRATAELDVSADGVLPGGDERVDVPALTGRVSLAWDGEGLPAGRVALEGQDLVVGERRVGRADIDLDVVADGSRRRVQGEVRLTKVNTPEIVAAELRVPVRLTVERLDRLPAGRVAVIASGVRAQGGGAGKLVGTFDLVPSRGGANVTGRIEADRLAAAGGIGVAAGSVAVAGWLGMGGEFDGTVGVQATGLRAPDTRVNSFTADLSVSAANGWDRQPELDGTFVARGVVAADMSAARVDGVIDGVVWRGDVATGDVTLTVADGHAGGRDIESAVVKVSMESDGQLDYTVRARAGTLVLDMEGAALLPAAGHPRIDIMVDRMVVMHEPEVAPGGRRGPPVTLLSASDLRWVDGGWIAVKDLDLHPVGGGDQRIQLSGRFEPFQGKFDLHLGVEGVDLKRWRAMVQDVLLVPLPALPEIGGVITARLSLTGTYDRPFLAMALHLSDGVFEGLTGIHAKLAASVKKDRIGASGRIGWHEEGTLDLQIVLPAQVGIMPWRMALDETRDLNIRIAGREAALPKLQAFLAGIGARAGERLEGQVFDGQASLLLTVTGPVSRPSTVLEVDASPLSLGAFESGRATLRPTSEQGATTTALYMDDVTKRRLVGLDVILPFDAGEVVHASDMGGFIESRLDAHDSTVKLDMPPIRIGATPLSAFVTPMVARITASAGLHIAGRLAAPRVDGHVAMDNIGYGGIASSTRLDMSTVADALELRWLASTRGRVMLDGVVTVPRLGDLLVAPDTALSWLRDPALHVQLFTPDMTGGDIWDLNAAVGDIATMLLPDGVMNVNVNVRGGADGPVANVMGRIRNPRRVQRTSDVNRNAADDVRVRVGVGPEGTSVAMQLTQRGEGERYVNLAATTSLGTAWLVDEDSVLPDVLTLPLAGKLLADGFSLDGLATAVRALGPSRGTLRGGVELGGTLGAPTANGSLEAWFEELNADAIGFHRDELNVVLLFEGRRAKLIPLRIEGTPSKGSKTGESYLELAFEAGFERLTDDMIDLKGSITITDFQLLDKKDMKGRFMGGLRIDKKIGSPPRIIGAVEVMSMRLSPELGGRNVRPIGLPKDVTMVRGEPIRPDDRLVVSPYATSAAIDVKVSIPKGKLHIINDLADLWPHGEIHAQTIGGELSLTGTIFVPGKDVTFYGRTFQIGSDSQLRFTGDMAIDPVVQLRAFYNLAEVDLSAIGLETTDESKITIVLNGSVQDLQPPELSSDPPMDETTLFSIILFGSPLASGGDSEATQQGVGDQVGNFVVGSVLGAVTGQLGRLLVDQLPVDSFKIDSESGDLAQSRLTVGKRLAKNLFLFYRANLGADEETESVHEITAEYRIGSFSVLGTAGDRGEFAVEAALKFRP